MHEGGTPPKIAWNDLVDAARRDGPTAEDLARITRKVFPVAPPPAPAPSATVAPGLLGKSVLGALGIFAVGAALSIRPSAPSPARPIARDPPSAPVPVAEPAESPRAPLDPNALPDAPPEPPRPAPLAKSPPVAADGESDAEMLARAMRALAARPTEALAITTAHAARFPKSGLGQERERIAIEALVATGDLTAARPRAARFLLAYPRSVHTERIGRLVGFDQKSAGSASMGKQEDMP